MFAGNTIGIALFVSGNVSKGFWGTKVKKNDIFKEGDLIATKDGIVEIQVGSGSVIRLSEYTEIYLVKMEEGNDVSDFFIVLKKGKIYGKVGLKRFGAPIVDSNEILTSFDSIKRHTSYKIKTSKAILKVKGTEFIAIEDALALGEGIISGIYMREGSGDIMYYESCTSGEISFVRYQFGCKLEKINLVAGKNIVFREEDYEISDNTVEIEEDMAIIDTFWILGKSEFHEIRQEYYDVGEYELVEYEEADAFNQKKSEENQNPQNNAAGWKRLPYCPQFNPCQQR